MLQADQVVLFLLQADLELLFLYQTYLEMLFLLQGDLDESLGGLSLHLHFTLKPHNSILIGKGA